MGRNSLAPASAATEGMGQDVDQLSSRIDSTNTKSADTNQAQLIKVIKAHIAAGDKLASKANDYYIAGDRANMAGDKAAAKADDHYIAAGQYLKELKGDLSQAEFLEIVREKIGIGKSRTYELLAIGDGTKTVQQVRADGAKRVREHDARKKIGRPLANGQNADDPEASAEAMKAKLAAADVEDSVNQETDENRFVSKLMKLDSDLARALYELLRHDKLGVDSSASDLRLALARGLGLDNDGDGDIEETEANPPRRRGRKPKFEETNLGAAVSNAFIVFEELAGECRDVVDNAPEGLSRTQRIETLDETAGVLENLSAPDVSAELAEIKLNLPIGRRPRSRGDQRDDALTIIAACIEALDNIDENDPRREEAQSLRDELENTSSEAETCVFPGMYG
jgi:hypothetical protein